MTTTHHAPHDTGSQPAIACSAFNATIHGVRPGGPGDAAGHHPLVDGVSVNLARGSFTAVTGRARSGARELVHALAGQRTLDAGRVFRTVDRVAFVPAQLDAARLSDAVARALATDPDMVVVDTFGWASSQHVLASLRSVARQRGITVVLATDDIGAAVQADRVLVIQDGRLVDDL